jgi:hypothetical protein
VVTPRGVWDHREVEVVQFQVGVLILLRLLAYPALIRFPLRLLVTWTGSEGDVFLILLFILLDRIKPVPHILL